MKKDNSIVNKIPKHLRTRNKVPRFPIDGCETVRGRATYGHTAIRDLEVNQRVKVDPVYYHTSRINANKLNNAHADKPFLWTHRTEQDGSIYCYKIKAKIVA